MIKLSHRISATLLTGQRKRDGTYKMGSYNHKKFKSELIKKNNYLLMELGFLLIKKEKYKTVRFID